MSISDSVKELTVAPQIVEDADYKLHSITRTRPTTVIT